MSLSGIEPESDRVELSASLAVSFALPLSYKPVLCNYFAKLIFELSVGWLALGENGWKRAVVG
jgi:hypothetical protein